MRLKITAKVKHTKALDKTLDVLLFNDWSKHKCVRYLYQVTNNIIAIKSESTGYWYYYLGSI